MTARYLIKTGQYAGQMFIGQCCFSRPTPTSELDYSLGEGVWFEELQLRLPKVITDRSKVKHCQDTDHYEDMVIAFDKYGNEIVAGDHLYVAVKNEVRKVRVLALTTINHAGYACVYRKMRCTDLDSGQTLVITTPTATILIKE